MRIKLTADSTIDLPKEILETHQISLSPLRINLEDTIYLDTINISVDDIYKAVAQGSSIPTTSAMNIWEYTEFFEQFKEYEHIIHFSLGSHFSSSYQNAYLAAQEVNNVSVIDTQNLSAGSGLLVLKAVKLIQSDMKVEDILSHLEQLIPKINVSFVLDTLEYMRKGGRISSFAEYGVQTLKIHPSISVIDGEMKVGRLFHGSLPRSLKKYVTSILSNKEKYEPDYLILAHSGLEDVELLESIYQSIIEVNYFKSVIVSRVGSTISTHSGPNTVGLLGILK